MDHLCHTLRNRRASNIGISHRIAGVAPFSLCPRAMNRYTLTKKLGDGTYGSVVKAVNRQTGEEVAVKKMKKLFTT